MSDHFDYNEFIASFKAQAQDLEDEISKSKTPDAKTIDQFSLNIGKLRSVVTEAVAIGCVPAYDQRLCEERVALLENSLAKLRANAKPKSKFSFKSSANTKPASQSSNNNNTAPGASFTPKQPSTTTTTSKISINGHHHKSLTFADAEGLDISSLSSAQSVVVTIGGLSDCFVDLASGTPPTVNALHVQGLKRTVLHAGKIQGSVLLHDCIGCTIIVSTHQFRMHTSNATDVFLEVLSNPVIEKCSDIRFGAYPPGGGTVIATESSRHAVSGDSLPYVVQDFDWMSATPSPHWSSIGSATFHLPITASGSGPDSVLDRLLPRIPSNQQS
ncbi:Tubulin-specific chaperone C OS=Bos taurus GN=TBCC PE=2 SV=1 [Rhizoctonia solani AG-1 IB]|uniref:Tubulin-specific chaperone C n=1 Tax=Thanatephorus cucumeris (strain AG1-IB / isolate 7/3/14) TaxID=1108050 RepID=A0A0B7FKX9_THACB|nr:Tubulin-specific chaperone C OS=Bos taurus GN=TBCC PE=2 SV=1 [Rhizoctonia solani AG-1 IB]